MKENENKNGYILLSADGTKPKCTFAALMVDDGTQIIAEGKKSEFLSALGSLACVLVTECNVPQNIILSAIKAAIISGNAWESIMNEMIQNPSENTIDKIKDMFM